MDWFDGRSESFGRDPSELHEPDLISTGISDPKSKFRHSSGSAGSKLFWYRVAPWSENRRPYSHCGRAFGDGDIHIF